MFQKRWMRASLLLLFVMSFFAFPSKVLAFGPKSELPMRVKIREGDVPFRLPVLAVKSETGKTKLEKVEYFLRKKERKADGTDYYLVEATGLVKAYDDIKRDSKSYQDCATEYLTIYISIWTDNSGDQYARIDQMNAYWSRSAERYYVKNANMVAQMWGYNVNGVQRTYRWDGPYFSPVFYPSGVSETRRATSPMNGWDPIIPTLGVSFGAVLSELWDSEDGRLVDRINFQVNISIWSPGI